LPGIEKSAGTKSTGPTRLIPILDRYKRCVLIRVDFMTRIGFLVLINANDPISTALRAAILASDSSVGILRAALFQWYQRDPIAPLRCE
jgi:hypothetical protein